MEYITNINGFILRDAIEEDCAEILNLIKQDKAILQMKLLKLYLALSLLKENKYERFK